MKLTIRSPQGTTTLEIPKDVVTIGRAPSNDVVIEDQKASRNHCRIELIEGKYKLTDLGSRNGTKLNGQRVQEASFSEGDEIRIGATRVWVGEVASKWGLLFMSGERQGRIVALPNKPMTLGRSASCDLVLEDPRVSSSHAEISPRDPEYVIKDLDSRNGTYINNQRVGEAILHENDVIRIGTFYLKFGSIESLTQPEPAVVAVAQPGGVSAWLLLLPLLITLGALGYYIYNMFDKIATGGGEPGEIITFDEVKAGKPAGCVYREDKAKCWAEKQEQGYALAMELGGGRAEAIVQREIVVKSDMPYSFAFALKTSDLRGAAGLRLRWFRKKSGVSSTSYILATGNNEGKQNQVVLSPAWADRLEISCLAFGPKGKITFDDIAWKEAEDRPLQPILKNADGALAFDERGVPALSLMGVTVFEDMELSILGTDGSTRTAQSVSMPTAGFPQMPNSNTTVSRLQLYDVAGPTVTLQSKWFVEGSGFRAEYSVTPDEDVANQGVLFKLKGQTGCLFSDGVFTAPSTKPADAQAINWILPTQRAVLVFNGGTARVSLTDNEWIFAWGPGTLVRNRPFSVSLEIRLIGEEEMARLEERKKRAMAEMTKDIGAALATIEEVKAGYPYLREAVEWAAQFEGQLKASLEQLKLAADKLRRKAELTQRPADFEAAISAYLAVARYAPRRPEGQEAAKLAAELKTKLDDAAKTRLALSTESVLRKAQDRMEKKDFAIARLYLECLKKRCPDMEKDKADRAGILLKEIERQEKQWREEKAQAAEQQQEKPPEEPPAAPAEKAPEQPPEPEKAKPQQPQPPAKPVAPPTPPKTKPTAAPAHTPGPPPAQPAPQPKGKGTRKPTNKPHEDKAPNENKGHRL